MTELTMLYPAIVTAPSASTAPVNMSAGAAHKLHLHHQDDELLDDDEDLGSVSSDGGRSSSTSKLTFVRNSIFFFDFSNLELSKWRNDQLRNRQLIN